MSKVTFSNVVLAGITLSANSFGLATAEPNPQRGSTTHQTNLENAQSINLVEGHWLKIPPLCKDRSISAEPTVLLHETVNVAVTGVHASLDQSANKV